MDSHFERLQAYLRMNGDYVVMIDPWGTFGCIWVKVLFSGKVIGYDYGKTLGKRVDFIIKKIEAHKAAATAQGGF